MHVRVISSNLENSVASLLSKLTLTEVNSLKREVHFFSKFFSWITVNFLEVVLE